MKNKFFISLFVALLCSLFLSNIGLAEEMGQSIYGEIVAIDENSFTMQNHNGDQFTFLIDEITNYRSSEIDEPSHSDLEVGGTVAVFAPDQVEVTPTARLVILLPGDFDPSQWAGTRVRGQIMVVNLEEHSFVIQTRSAQEQTFIVDDSTRFFGKLSGYNDLQAGVEVVVGGMETDDGDLIARLVIEADLLNAKSHVGTITQVIPAAGTFTLQTRQGEERMIAVDANTNYNSRAGEIEGLNDLLPDMVAMVYGVLQGDGVFLASHVIAGDADDLPNYDVKALGQIIAIGDDSITIQSRNGEEMVFLVDDETNFRSRGNAVTSLDDLEVSMFTLVGAYEKEDGQMLAKLVFVRVSRKP